MAIRLAAAAGAVGLLAACGEDDPAPEATLSGDWDVLLVVGDARFDDGADPAAFPAIGQDFTEHWVLECDGSGCLLRRPDGGVLLGDLDELRLTPDPEVERRLVGTATGVQPVPGAEVDPCLGTAATTWSVRVEADVASGQLVGSVIREPEALVVAAGDADCFGLDLTLGFSGIRRESPGAPRGSPAPPLP